MVLNTHILPDIIGNMRSYSSQTFRSMVVADSVEMPLMGKCIDCGSALIQTVTRGADEKYLYGIATDMCKQYKINDYLLRNKLNQ